MSWIKNQSINPYANLQKIDIIHIRFRWILIYFDDLFDNALGCQHNILRNILAQICHFSANFTTEIRNLFVGVG